MSAFRFAAALSFALHAAAVGAFAVLVRTGGPVGIGGAGPSSVHEIGVVALAQQSRGPKPPTAPASLPSFPAAAPIMPLPDTLTAPTLPPLPPPVQVAVANRPPDVVPVSHHALTAPPAVPSAGNSRGSMTPGASTSFFNVPAVGRSVVFVIDRSSSMGRDGRFDRAREQVIASLRSLPTSTRFQVIAYDAAAAALRVGAGRLAAPTRENVAAAVEALEAMFPEGSSGHRRALQLALSLGPDVIYFLTDEDDLTPADVAEITRLNAGRVSIHALCFDAPPPGDTPMRRLARLNRGTFRVAGE